MPHAADCYNVGATMLHVYVRDPETGESSANFDHYNYRQVSWRRPALVFDVSFARIR